MQKRKIKIKDPCGLHLRNAAKLVKSVRECRAKITVCHGRATADCCSIIDLVSLGVGKNAELKIIIEGPDEKAAARKIDELFDQGGGI